MSGKYILTSTAILFFLANNCFSQSIKKVKTQVTFKNLGELTTITTTRINGIKEREDKENRAKGSGIINNAIAKIFLKSGSEGEITDLNKMLIYKMDNKKKVYQVIPIEKYEEPVNDESNSENVSSSGEETQKQDQSDQKEDNDVKLIRQEFKVEKTNESKKINGFDCNRYTILWLTEWQNTNTKETTTDSLFTNVWTTPMNGNIKQVQNDESAFNEAYMKKLGINLTDQQKELLGTEWISLLNKMKPADKSANQNDMSKVDYSQMNKIKGYPVVIDGRFFEILPQKEESKKEEKTKPKRSVRGMFGRLAKKVIKKKLTQPKQTGPDLHFYTEVLELKPVSLDESVFQVPNDYKKQ